MCVYRQRAGKSYSENNHLLGILVKRQTNKTECGIQKQAYMNTASLLLANVQRQFNPPPKKSPLKEQCWKFLDINVQTKMNYNLHAQVMHYLIQKRL